MLLVVAVIAAVGMTPEQETVPRTPNPHPAGGVTLEPSPTSSTNIPGGGLAACVGQEVLTESAPVGRHGGLTLQVYYADNDGGRTCATVTKDGAAVKNWGELSVTLRLHSYDGRRWPRYASYSHHGTDPRSPAIYLDDTKGRCVRAEARFDPDPGRAVTLTSGKIGCGRRTFSAGSPTPP